MMKQLLMLVLAFVLGCFSAAAEEAGSPGYIRGGSDSARHLEKKAKRKNRVFVRGTPGTKRGQEWLASNRSYVDESLDWSADLKKMADSLTAESAQNMCEIPSREQLHEIMKTICQDASVVGQACYYNWAIRGGGMSGLSALPSTDEAFEEFGMPKVPVGYEKVGCSDCLQQAPTNRALGYWSSVCLYYAMIPANKVVNLP